MTDKRRAPKLPLAPRDLLILAVLADGPNHGYGLIKEVEQRSDDDVRLDPANLYRALRRLRDAGWIEDEPQRESTRRTHCLTRSGRHVLQAEVERLERLLQQTRPALAGGER